MIPGCVTSRLPACTHIPHREGNSMGTREGLIYLILGSETNEGVAKIKVSPEHGNQTEDPWCRAQYNIQYATGYQFTTWP